MRSQKKRPEMVPKGTSVPHLFLLGVPKAGTTSLAEMLHQTGQFCYGRRKESGILAADYSISARKQLYLDHYQGCDLVNQTIMDGSPWYGYRTDLPELLDKIGAEDPFLMLSLRDPLARASSMYKDQVRRGVEKRTFQEAIRHELRTLERSSVVGARDYVRGSQYSPVVKNSIRACASRSPIIVFMELLEDETSGQLDWLAGTLATGKLRMASLNRGVDESIRGLSLLDHLVSISHRLPASARLVLRRRGDKILRRVRARLPRRAIPSIDAEVRDLGLREELHAVFSEDIQELKPLLQKTAHHVPSLRLWLRMLNYRSEINPFG